MREPPHNLVNCLGGRLGVRPTPRLKLRSFEALSSQQKNAIDCQKMGGTYKSLIIVFREVYGVSLFDSFTELTNIRMREGESIAAFSNWYQGWLPSDYDPNNNFLKHHFICKLPTEVQMPWAVRVYKKKASFHEIFKACNKVHKLMLTHSSKRSRTQVNALEDNSHDQARLC